MFLDLNGQPGQLFSQLVSKPTFPFPNLETASLYFALKYDILVFKNEFIKYLWRIRFITVRRVRISIQRKQSKHVTNRFFLLRLTDWQF